MENQDSSRQLIFQHCLERPGAFTVIYSLVLANFSREIGKKEGHISLLPYMFLVARFFFLLVVLLFDKAVLGDDGDVQLDIPYFCVDKNVLKVFSSRLSCLGLEGSTNPVAALAGSDHVDAGELQHSQEVMAYQWFVLEKHNPYRVECVDSRVRLEYIPLLPLNWLSEQLGAVSEISGPLNSTYKCSYASLINDIEKYVQKRLPSSRKLFAVAGTRNLRTQMGVLGLRENIRKGEQYDAITKFVTSVYLGHYERFPQCPDLLRKHWPGAIELPSVPLSFFGGQSESDSRISTRDIKFLFAGRMWLFGPERVCSVRNAVASLVKGPLADAVHVVNTTSRGAVIPVPAIEDLYRRAEFCLITKADSYSTAALYSAVWAGCVPIIISDWLVPALNWAIPWSELVVRINEQDFLASPSSALLTVREQYEHLLPQFQEKLHKWRTLLSYKRTKASTTAGIHEDIKYYAFTSPDTDGQAVVVPSLELFLMEVLYHPGTSETPKSTLDPKASGLSCETPYHCPRVEFLVPPLQLTGKQGGQDERSFLCQNVHRLIGQYKMVYNQKCVRILWPLRPGHFKPFDLKRISEDEKAFVEEFHRIGFSPRIYPYESAGLSSSSLGGKGIIPFESL